MSRIAIDYTAAHEQGGGIGRYVRELTRAIARHDPLTEFRFFVAGATPASLPQLNLRNVSWRATRVSPAWLARTWHRARLPLPVEAFTGAVDLFHATDFVLPPTLPGTRTLLTVHDLSFERVPSSAEPSLLRYLRSAVPKSVRRADHILADSQASKDDLAQLYDTPEEKITVLYCGIDEQFAPPADSAVIDRVLEDYGLRGAGYLLSVGTLQPRKNYPRVIRAVKHLRECGIDLHYVIAGGKGWLVDEIDASIAENRMQDRVHLLGFVEDEQLPALYGGAKALVAPSLYEGFGLPLLEAMACGAPVITSNLSSLPEVAGDAGIQVDPTDVSAIAEAIAQVANDADLRADMIQRGFKRATQFSWERSARQLKAVYDRLLRD